MNYDQAEKKYWDQPTFDYHKTEPVESWAQAEALCCADDPEGGAARRGTFAEVSIPKAQLDGLVHANQQLASTILLILDQIDFTHGACSPAESVGAVIDSRILKLARTNVKEFSTVR